MSTKKELEERVGILEGKVDVLLAASQAKKPAEPAQPWPLEKFPQSWRDLGTRWIVVNLKAIDGYSYNGVDIPLVKAVPWEVPINIAEDLKRKGWA